MYGDIRLRNQIQLKTSYNKLKKRLEKLTWFAQRNYYSERIDEIKQNSKMLWKTINEIVCRKSKKGGIITHLKTDDGGIIYDPNRLPMNLTITLCKSGKNCQIKFLLPQKHTWTF